MTDAHPAPVVCIHGLGSCGADWAPLVGALARGGRTVLTPDLPGHAGVPYRGRRVTIRDHAAHVERWLAARGVRHGFHVVGMSLGAMVALELVAGKGSEVRSLALLSAAIDTRLRSWRACLVYGVRRLAFDLLGNRLHARWLAGRLFPFAGQRALRDDFVARWSLVDRAAYRACLRGSAGWTIRGREGALRCPTLVLRGGRDFFPGAPLRALVGGLATAELVELPGLGHAFAAEAPELTAATLAAFVERVEAGELVGH
ncbi:MAG: alpha/beta hydrolase [Planctomycetes bacterium]|nr:alpha/beta hydrolase [Planctomycetota bacterium]